MDFINFADLHMCLKLDNLVDAESNSVAILEACTELSIAENSIPVFGGDLFHKQSFSTKFVHRIFNTLKPLNEYIRNLNIKAIDLDGNEVDLYAVPVIMGNHDMSKVSDEVSDFEMLELMGAIQRVRVIGRTAFVSYAEDLAEYTKNSIFGRDIKYVVSHHMVNVPCIPETILNLNDEDAKEPVYSMDVTASKIVVICNHIHLFLGTYNHKNGTTFVFPGSVGRVRRDNSDFRDEVYAARWNDSYEEGEKDDFTQTEEPVRFLPVALRPAKEIFTGESLKVNLEKNNFSIRFLDVEEFDIKKEMDRDVLSGNLTQEVANYLTSVLDKQS